MQQIADWLRMLGLPEYAERFAENGIDVSVLPHLTDQDLKDMGVLLGLLNEGPLEAQRNNTRGTFGCCMGRQARATRRPNRRSR